MKMQKDYNMAKNATPTLIGVAFSLNFVLFSPKHRRPFESMSDGFANSAIEFANLNESFAKISSYFAKHRNYSASPITFR